MKPRERERERSHSNCEATSVPQWQGSAKGGVDCFIWEEVTMGKCQFYVNNLRRWLSLCYYDVRLTETETKICAKLILANLKLNIKLVTRRIDHPAPCTWTSIIYRKEKISAVSVSVGANFSVEIKMFISNFLQQLQPSAGSWRWSQTPNMAPIHLDRLTGQQREGRRRRTGDY